MIQRLTFFSFLVSLTGCVSNDLIKPFDCSTVSISVALVSKADVTSCAAQDGRIEVSVDGGEGPYEYSINGGTFKPSSTFSNLSSGSYKIEVRDVNGCLGTLLPLTSIVNPTSDLEAEVLSFSNDTECLTNNGTLTIGATGGEGPYTYKLDNGSFVDNATFGNLGIGSYAITVKDSDGCTFTITKTISSDTGVSWSGEIKNIVDTNCAITGCHNGNTFPDLRELSNVQNNKSQIRSRTQSGNMPRGGTLTADEKAKIACWIDDGAKSN